MALRPLIHGFWLTGIGLQLSLGVVLMLRKSWTKFPLFSTYAFFNLFEAGLTYAVSGNGMVYFYTYSMCEAIATTLGLAVVYEVFTSLFLPHPALRKLARTVFRIAVLILIALGIAVVYTQSQTQRSNIGSAVMVVGEATRLIELGLLMFLFLFSSAFGLHWRAHIFGIALGLGIFSAVDLINLALHAEFGGRATDVLNLVKTFAFNISLLLWSSYLLAPERATNVGEIPKRAQLEQWNQAVTELISR